MKHYLPKNTEDGAALIVTLLIVVLLATISVSFFSTARIEQTATRNYTSKTQAEQFAILATQQAMAKIQKGFTASGTGTTVITTQPGAIWQFVFQNGNITSNSTFNLFSGNGSGNVTYMNNLENPSSNSSASSNQYTITGNRSQRLNVFMENVTTTVNGTTQVLGRIAYYVDDELTKLNINAATANRSTLNVADSRTLSLTTLSNNTTTLGNFQNSINGTISNTSDIATWGYFFRPEQATASGNNTLNLSPSNDLPYLTALPPRDFHMKYTPWGARRLFINDTTEVPLNSNGVNKTVEAISSQHLKNIYGQTFADKYNTINGSATAVPVGLKQIAANMLQRKFSRTRHHNDSYAYTGPLLGGDNLDSDGIPKEYLGQASFPSINEVGISARLAVELSGGNIRMRNILQVCIETIGWETGGAATTSNNTGRIIVDLDSLTYDLNYSATVNGSTTNSTISLGGTWPVNGTNGPFTQFCTNSASTYTQNFAWEDPNDWRTYDSKPPYWTINAIINRNSGNPNLSYILNGYAYRYHIGTLGRSGRGGEISMGFSYNASSNIRINSISNMRASIKRIRLLANFNDNSTIRDWVVAGRDVGGFDISPVTYTKTGSGTTTTTETMSGSTKTTTVVTQFPTIVLPLSYNATTGNFTCNASTLKFTTITKKNPSAEWTEGPYVDEGPSSTFTTNSIATWADPEPIFAPSQSYGRLDPRLKSVSSLGNPASPWPASNNNATFAWGHYGNSTWGSSATLNLMQGYGYIGQLNVIHGEADKVGSNRLFTSNSSWTKNNLISGDPLPNSWRTEAIYDHFFHSEGAWFLDSGGDVKGVRKWPYFFKKSTSQVNGSDSGLVFTDASGNRVFMAPNDLGTVATNYPWRTLRMQIQPRIEISSTDGGGNMTSQSLIPDWAMLDVISFGMNSTTIPLNFSSHVNLNNKFVTPNGTLSSNRSQSLESLLRSLDSVSAADGLMFRNPFRLSGNYATASSNLGDYAFLPSGNTTCYDQLGNATLAAGLSGSNATWSKLLSRNIGNMTWSPSSFWGSNNTATARVRKSKGFPENQLVLPSEVAEIRDIADLVSTNSTTLLSSTRYTNAPRHIKSNELRLSPFFPGATTCSNFFTIYAYAQALDKAGNVDSEHLTKTLVEVEITTPATATSAAVYKVKSLYTQSIPMGD
jgi:Tfp pilus assembly protein PilX